MSDHSVYGHYNSEGELKYVGQGKGRRPWAFYGRSKAWESYFKNVNPEVRIFYANLSKQEAKKLESSIINDLTMAGVELLNIHSERKGWLRNKSAEQALKDRSGKNNPNYGKKPSKETIEKMLATKTKNNSFARYWEGKKRDPDLISKLTKASHTPEATEKRRQSMIGRTLTEEHREKISEANKGRVLSQDTKDKISKAKKGQPNGLEGRVMPLEHRKKISEAHKGKKMPREGVEKQRRAVMGRPSPKRKPVKCIENGRIYSHAKEAAEDLDCNLKHVQAVCAGRRKRTGGYHFMYVEA